jgi:ABC-2 type transport system ATP-binding protein
MLSQSTATTAVNNTSFKINQGEIVGILGHNGSGKTTTIYMLTGTLEPTSGTITYFGKDFSRHRSQVLQHVGFASSGTQLPAALSVNETLDIHTRLYGLSHQERKNRIANMLKAFGMWHMKDTKARNLSHGEATRILIAKAFLTNPKIVLLDEATAPLDPEIAKEVRRFLTEQCSTNQTSILLASHNMSEVASLCHRVLILKEGSIIADTTPTALAQQVTKVRLIFNINEPSRMITVLENKAIPYVRNRDDEIQLELNEDAIATTLQHLARADIIYSRIAIEKPSLEDYFLNITTQTPWKS